MQDILTVTTILALGYLIGRITVKDLSLGTSSVLLVALIFGHFGITIPVLIKNLGLVCFVASVGLIAGPTFFMNLKKGAMHYIILGITTIIVGVCVCAVIIMYTDIPTALALGLLNGALTSTPGLAVALEATGDPIASIGYGVAYPFGVLGVVLFVQLLPRILNVDMRKEIDAMTCSACTCAQNSNTKSLISIDNLGIFSFSIAVVFGLLLGNIQIPLGKNASFSFGASGGPLLAGLLIGHMGHIYKISLSVPKKTLEVMREVGLACFLLGAGTEAGHGFMIVLEKHGLVLFFVGAMMTLLPMVVTFYIATKYMHLLTMDALGALCGGMTSTPALGSLITVSNSDYVTMAYVATYPVALVMIVVLTQFLALIY